MLLQCQPDEKRSLDDVPMCAANDRRSFQMRLSEFLGSRIRRDVLSREQTPTLGMTTQHRLDVNLSTSDNI